MPVHAQTATVTGDFFTGYWSGRTESYYSYIGGYYYDMASYSKAVSKYNALSVAERSSSKIPSQFDYEILPITVSTGTALKNIDQIQGPTQGLINAVTFQYGSFGEDFVWVSGVNQSGLIILPRTYPIVYYAYGDINNPEIQTLQKNSDKTPYYEEIGGRTYIYVDHFSGAGGTLYAENDGAYYDGGSVYSVLPDQWIAQSFTTNATFSAMSVDVKMWTVNPATIGTINVTMQMVDGNHYPTGTVLATNSTFDVTGLPNDSGNVTFVSIVFDSPTTLSINTEYAIVMRPGTVNNTSIWGDNRFVYSGNASATIDGGVTWTGPTNEGSDRMFRIWGDPVSGNATTVTTSPATLITYTSAQLNGNLDDIGSGNVTIEGFQWGTSSGIYDNSVNSTGDFSAGPFNLLVSPLSENDTYYYQAYAFNDFGFSFGGEQSFSTSAYLSPSITTNAASSINYVTATLSGNITNVNGDNAVVRGFKYGTVSGTENLDTNTSGNYTEGVYTAGTSSLSQNTTYYFYAYATNLAGTGVGAEQNFTTLAFAGVNVSTTGDTPFVTSALLNGNIDNTGGDTVITRGFGYDTVSGPPYTFDIHEDGSFGAGAFFNTAPGLSSNTTYFFRAYATNSINTTYGQELSFNTLESGGGSPSAPQLTGIKALAYLIPIILIVVLVIVSIAMYFGGITISSVIISGLVIAIGLGFVIVLLAAIQGIP